MVLALLASLASAQQRVDNGNEEGECGELSLSTDFWLGASQVHNTLDGRLKLELASDDAVSTTSTFTTTFSEPQDLTRELLLAAALTRIAFLV